MSDTNLWRLTGLTGAAAAVLTLIELPLYFVYDGPPPAANVLTRSLFGILGLTCLTVFAVGLRRLLTARGSRPDGDFAPVLASVAGVMWVVVEFVSNGLETGAVIAAPGPIDPTISVSGTYILYGSTTRLIEALFLIAFGAAVAGSGVLPRWTIWSSYLLAGINLFFVPSLYFGNDPANFYAANGWGTTATMGGLFMLWLLSISISVLRRAGAVAAGPAPASMPVA
ncbi:hypothetical protein [Saccharopolyspora sp. NPDC002686]|uniref:hypothetical protein n=1 Tax=Saccharopolyspora sp. NPDC002686 TaxID=3154541 RepID=UPI0033278D60